MEEIQIIEINSKIESLISQRNAAMNDAVNLNGELSKSVYMYNKLTEEFEKVKAEIAELRAKYENEEDKGKDCEPE